MSAATLLRTVTDPVRRRPAVAVLVGVIAGIFSGIVKFGWEVPFPPRSPERDATNPPQALLELLGMSPEATHQTYTYLGNDLPWVSFIVHFAFAISFAVLYCVVAEYRPGITLWQGAVFGLAVWVAFHLVVMPLMGIVPAPWEQPFRRALLRGPGPRGVGVVHRDRAPRPAQPDHRPAGPVGAAAGGGRGLIRANRHWRGLCMAHSPRG